MKKYYVKTTALFKSEALKKLQTYKYLFLEVSCMHIHNVTQHTLS